MSPIPKVNPARSPPVNSFQLLATSWVKNSRAKVMTVGATEPDRAPARPRPIPTTTATASVTPRATPVAGRGPISTSASPHGAFGIRVYLSSGAMANIAKTYPATAPKPMWPKENTPVLPT